MTLLDECHAKGFLYKAIGGCNDVKRQVNVCLGAARSERSRKNREQGKNSKEKIEKLWVEDRVDRGVKA
jgi:COX assembly protein 2